MPWIKHRIRRHVHTYTYRIKLQQINMYVKNRVHYVQETGPVESWKIKDDDFSIWSLNQFA